MPSFFPVERVKLDFKTLSDSIRYIVEQVELLQMITNRIFTLSDSLRVKAEVLPVGGGFVMTEAKKVCIKCKDEQELSSFHKDASKRDGLSNKCKACAKEYQRAYYQANTERLDASMKAYRMANAEKVLDRERAYREANAEIVEMRAIIRRAKRGDIPALEIYGLPDRESVRKLRLGKLAIYRDYYPEGEPNLDHMEPLAGARGDAEELNRRSHFTNLVYIPEKANLSKHAKPFWNWLEDLNDEKLFNCIAEQDSFNRNFLK